MLVTKYTIETSASSATIWNIWQDVANWNTWDQGIECSILKGLFQTGSSGTLKPKGGPSLTFTLTLVEPLKTFIAESKLPFAQIIVSHFLKERQGKTFVTHQTEMKGPLAFLFAYLIGRNIKKTYPKK